MIGIKDQDTLLDRVVDELLHPEHPTSCNLVIPPGFGDARLVRDMVRRLERRAQECGALVAFVEPDGCKDASDYVTTLHAQWSRLYRLPGLERAERDHWALNTLI